MDTSVRYLVVAVCVLLCIVPTLGHGRLLEPPGRSSMWRFGYDTPVNYNDNQLFCGGYRNTVVYDGNCGVCGDPYQGPFENEAGGKYATGTIARFYDASSTHIKVTVDISAHHRGQFEFRLCPNNDVNTRVTQQCLDTNVLHVEGGQDGGLHFVPLESGIHHIRLVIPPGLKCSQCVLQWKYTTGNFWGVNKKNGEGCIGCGDQELFVNCADIAIADDKLYKLQEQPSARDVTSVSHSLGHHEHAEHSHGIHFRGNATAKHASTKPDECNRCYALPTWRHFPDMDNWCDSNCKVGNCPPCRCYCGCPKISFENPCVGTGEYDSFEKMAGWCWRECCESECPVDKCACSESVKYPSHSGYNVETQFFDVPLMHMFPGSKGAISESDEGSNSDESDDSSDESDDSSDESSDSSDSSSSDEHHHHSKPTPPSPISLTIKPPEKALINSNAFTNLFRKQWISLPGTIHPDSVGEKNQKQSSLSKNVNLKLSEVKKGKTTRVKVPLKDSKSAKSRFGPFVLSEVHVMKVNKTSLKGDKSVKETGRANNNILSRFSLGEVKRTRVNINSPSETSIPNSQEIVKDHLSIDIPRLAPFFFDEVWGTGTRKSSITENTNQHPGPSAVKTPEVGDAKISQSPTTTHAHTMSDSRITSTVKPSPLTLNTPHPTIEPRKANFLHKMAVDPRLLSSVLELQPSLSKFINLQKPSDLGIGDSIHSNIGDHLSNSGVLHSNSVDVHSNSGDLHSNSVDVHSNSGDLHSNIDDHHSNIGALHSNIGEHRSNIGEHHSNIDDHHSNIGALHSNIGEHRSNIGEHHSNIDDHHSNIGDLHSNIGEHHSNIDDHHSNIGDLHSNIDDHHSNSGDLHGNIDDHHSNIGDLHSNSGDLHSNSGDLHGNIDDHHSNSGDLHSNSGDLHSNNDDHHSNSGIFHSSNYTVKSKVNDSTKPTESTLHDVNELEKMDEHHAPINNKMDEKRDSTNGHRTVDNIVSSDMTPSTKATTVIHGLTDSENLLKEVSKNIINKKNFVENILNEEDEIDGRKEKGFRYHKLNLMNTGTGNKDPPYVIDARLLHKMLKSVQSWFNHPMYVVH